MPKQKLLGVLVCLAVLAPAVAAAATVTIHNKSDWDIHQFFLSPSESDDWGPDQLGEHVLASGGSFQLRNIPCDTYDVMLVDEDGDECVVAEVDICGGKGSWVVDNDDLLECEGYGE